MFERPVTCINKGMQWTPGGTSSDIEDRRDSGGGGGMGFGGGGGMRLGIGGTIVVGLLSLIFGRNLFDAVPGGSGTSDTAVSQPNPERSAAEKPQVDFISFVLDDAQNTWDRIMPEQTNTQYRHARLVLFRDAYPSGCGRASSSIGPFYCPEDQKVYLDLSFLNELRTRFGAPGEFAQAYVIAHELGHHVQKLLGIEPKMRRLQQQNPEARNELSVRLELQADCFSGIWANTTEQRQISDNQDVAAAIGAASAVGDDRLQRAGQGYVNPESFTHGSSADRVAWFKKGLQSGQLSSCQTF
jgi:predicted metalloprotease